MAQSGFKLSTVPGSMVRMNITEQYVRLVARDACLGRPMLSAAAQSTAKFATEERGGRLVEFAIGPKPMADPRHDELRTTLDRATGNTSKHTALGDSVCPSGWRYNS